MFRRILLVFVVIGALYWSLTRTDISAPVSSAPATQVVEAQRSADDSERIRAAFDKQQSDVQVRASAVVTKVLSDDNDGSRHQRFIVELVTGQLLLISHNIDLAPRVDSLAEGDRVEFYGEYEWNNKGGVVHWTHHDPAGRHVGGWIKHNGKTYQ
jgi:hypothetical protein